jgi:hypothetical protein
MVLGLPHQFDVKGWKGVNLDGFVLNAPTVAGILHFQTMAKPNGIWT